MKYLLALVAIMLPLVAATANAETAINVGEASVEAASVDANAGALAGAQVTGSEFGTVTFEATQPLAKQKIGRVPDAIAPSIVGGNPCVVSASGAGSGMGFGFAIGVGIEDPDCEIRQQVALMANMGARSIAILHFCLHSEDVQETVAALGYNCTELQMAVAERDGGLGPKEPIFPANGAGVILGSPSSSTPTPKPMTVATVLKSDGFRWEAGSDR